MPSTIPTYKTHDISAARNPRHLQAKHNVLSLPKIQSNEAPQTHYQAKERTCPTFIPSHGWNTCGLLWSAVDYIHHNLNQSETSQNGCTHTHTHTHTHTEVKISTQPSKNLHSDKGHYRVLVDSTDLWPTMLYIFSYSCSTCGLVWPAVNHIHRVLPPFIFIEYFLP